MMIVPNVCLIHFNSMGEILSIARRNDHTKVGLPGGKVDPDDLIAAGGGRELALKIACSREVMEETGLVIMPHDLIEVWRGPCVIYGTDRSWINVTYMARRVITSIPPQENEPPLSWQTSNVLASSEHSPFAEYNASVFQSLGILF